MLKLVPSKTNPRLKCPTSFTPNLSASRMWPWLIFQDTMIQVDAARWSAIAIFTTEHFPKSKISSSSLSWPIKILVTLPKGLLKQSKAFWKDFKILRNFNRTFSRPLPSWSPKSRNSDNSRWFKIKLTSRSLRAGAENKIRGSIGIWKTTLSWMKNCIFSLSPPSATLHPTVTWSWRYTPKENRGKEQTKKIQLWWTESKYLLLRWSRRARTTTSSWSSGVDSSKSCTRN